jgi:hypothetical protein
MTFSNFYWCPFTIVTNFITKEVYRTYIGGTSMMPSVIKFAVFDIFSMPSSSVEVLSSSLVSAIKGDARETGIFGNPGNVAILVFSRLTVRGPVELVVLMWGNETTGFFNLLVPNFGGILHVAYKSPKGEENSCPA